ncbi:hypothetical protein FOZ60_007347 [Perkinsus olseni]|uniref:Uncharacterized protein n=1 Tax=Perkinsus olseni TaxID=32597 RepID=A0A7J6NLR0_PEROL|nr:hypothetical protein FOZ60_007347 [Perkinsus olseni]
MAPAAAAGESAWEHGRQALLAAGNAAQDGFIEIHHYIEQGPNGLSVACFVGGVLLSIVSLLSIIDVFSIPFHPFNYLLNFFILAMALITILIEATPDMLKGRQEYQTKVFDNAKILTYIWGRGIFYLFQGLLAMVEPGLLYMIVGIIQLVLGVSCIAIWKGYKPRLSVLREKVAAGTGRVAQCIEDGRGNGSRHVQVQ